MRRFWSEYGIFIVLLLAFAIQFALLDARTLHGDEFGSINEAKQLGRNFNSVLYFATLNAWLSLGDGEFWLRSPSALATVFTGAVTFTWVKLAYGKEAATATALLLATNPFLIVYGQQIRFYGFALVTASLSVWAFIYYLKHGTLRAIALWGIASLLAVTTLLLNGLLLLCQGITVFFLSQLSARRKIVIVGLVVVTAILLVALPAVRQFAFDTLAIYTNADSRYSASRGLTFTQIVKIPATGFFFIFGESVYPLTYWLVIPGICLWGVAFAIGARRVWQNRQVAVFIALSLVIAPLLLYLVFDPLSPPTLQGAAPRYLIFLLPLLIVLGAAMRQSKIATWVTVSLLLVNLSSLLFYWYGDWAYTDDRIDWRGVTRWVSNHITAQTSVLLDGRAQEVASRYFPPAWNQSSLWTWESNGTNDLAETQRIIVISNDFHQERRSQTTALMRELEKNYIRSDVWANYPTFIYVYDRADNHAGTYRVDRVTGSVNLPVEIYGLEFQDIHLPVAVNLKGRSTQISGALRLFDQNSPTSRMLPLAKPTSVHSVWLLSNMTEAQGLKLGTLVANLKLIADDNSFHTLPIRYGVETSAWNERCQTATCSSIYSWHKRIALLGTERYPESWKDFEAFIFAGKLILPNPISIRALEFKRVESPGTLYIWGMMFEP